MAKMVLGTPLALDVSANFLFNDKFTLGAAYRWSAAVSALAIFIGPIHFDLDKSNIRLNAAVENDKIVSIMEEHPTLEIDVRSHTDSRNDDAYNMTLSEKRNKATIQYLVDKGISRSRLTGRGYGETQLVDHCSNGVQCPDEVHEQNRRSEFIITKR